MKPTITICAMICVILLTSFSKSSVNKSVPKEYREHFVYVPSGSVSLTEQIISKGSTSDTESSPAVLVNDFFMFKYEVTNGQYRMFLNDIKQSGNVDLYNKVNVDTTAWRDAFSYNEPYVTYYYQHPAYENYPLVNVSYEGAAEYCKWLTGKLNETAVGTDYGYLVRLPSRSEWVRAANSSNPFGPYAWGGPLLRNKQGCPLCNYAKVNDAGITRNAETGNCEIRNMDSYLGVAGTVADDADITAPVHSYSPNEFGLYNMNGNVAEMVAEKGMAVGGSWHSPGYDVRNLSVSSYNKPMPTVGFRPVMVLMKRST